MFEPEKLFEWKRWAKLLVWWFPVAVPFAYFAVRYDSGLFFIPLVLYALFLNWNFFK